MLTDQRLRNLVAAAGQRLFPPRTTGVIAISGGADSVSLAHLLWRLSRRFGWQLLLAHVDHGLRKDSCQDAQFVHRLGQRWGLSVALQRVDVPAWARRHRLGLEAAGRELRYQQLTRLALRHQASWVAVGHTLDDQAETVLMHVIRGTGPSGLTGIPARRPLTDALWLGRPLLEIPRAELVRYLKRHHLPFREDPTNRHTRFFRNRIRHELLPLLERYNPRIKTHLASLARIVQIEERGWEPVVRRSMSQTVRRYGKNTILDLAQFFRYDKALQLRLLRSVVGPIPFGSLAQLFDWVASGAAGGRIALPGGWIVSREKGRLGFWHKPPSR